MKLHGPKLGKLTQHVRSKIIFLSPEGEINLAHKSKVLMKSWASRSVKWNVMLIHVPKSVAYSLSGVLGKLAQILNEESRCKNIALLHCTELAVVQQIFEAQYLLPWVCTNCKSGNKNAHLITFRLLKASGLCTTVLLAILHGS